MKLTHLLSCLPFYQTSSAVDNIDIKSIQMDDRKVNEGSLFVCIKGFTVDGHEYAKKSGNNGALAVIAEKDLALSVPVIVSTDTTRVLAMLASKCYNHPTHTLPLIGISGRNGKTTISYLLETIFEKHKKK